MNTRRLVVLLLAAGAAGVVALMVRGFVGGGAKQAEAMAHPGAMSVTQVLVAAIRLEPGQMLGDAQVRWQEWPSKSVSPGLIVKRSGLSAAAAVEGTVVRSPIVEGEPITFTKIIKSQAAGFMAATIAPGMRAVAIPVSVASVAGGFIMPNDRVDLICTIITGDNPKRGTAQPVVTNVRVLAIDQAADSKNQKAVSDVKTVTLELTPRQTESVALSQAMGTLSLALRSLGDNETLASNRNSDAAAGEGPSAVSVIRYGSARRGETSSGAK